MALLERLAILITADAAGAIGEIKKVADAAEKDLGKAGKSSDDMSKTMTKAGAAMLGVGAGLLTFGVSAASSTANLGREVIKLQRYTGQSAEETSRLNGAARLAGVSADTLALGLGRLSKAAEAGSPAFDKLGVTTRNADGSLRSMGQMLPDVAEAFKNMPGGAERTALALQLFGRNGMEMMPFLLRGREGIAELSKEAEKMGLVLSGDNISQIKAHIMAQRELSATFEGLRTKVGLQMMPILTGFTDVVKGIPGPVLDVIGPLTVFGGLGLTAAGGIGMLIGQLNNLKAPLVALQAFALDNPIMLGLIGFAAAVAAITIAINSLGDSQKQHNELVKQYSEALSEGTAAAEASTKAKLEDALSSKKLMDAVNAAGLSIGGMSAIVREGSDYLHTYAQNLGGNVRSQVALLRGEFDKASPTVDAFIQSLGRSVASGQITEAQYKKIITEVDNQSTAYAEAKTKQDALDASQQTYTAHVSLLEQAQNNAAEATNNHKKAADDLNKALRDTFDPLWAMIDAQDKVTKGQKDITEATNDLATKVDALNKIRREEPGNLLGILAAENDVTEARKKLDSATISAGRSANDYDAAQRSLLGSLGANPKALDDAKKKLDEYRASGVLTAEQVQILKGRLDDAVAIAKGFPSAIEMTLRLNSWDFWSNIGAVKAYLDTMTPDEKAIAAATMASARAAGGPVDSGSLYLVGEQGPELFVPRNSGTIIPAGPTAAMIGSSSGTGGGGSGGGDINVFVNQSNASPYDIGRELLWAQRVTR